MITWFTRFTVGALTLAVVGLTACKKDETQIVAVNAGAPSLTASTTTPDLSLTVANASTTAATFAYTTANFGYQSVITYTLQFDKKGGNFNAPITFSGGTSAGSLALTTSQLVNVYTRLNLPYGTSSQVDVRVVASVGANTQQASSIVTLTGTPNPVFIPNASGLSWGLVGPAADGWPGTTLATATDRVMTYDGYSQTFKLHTTLTAGAFKFRANKDWGTNLGGVGSTYSTGVTLTPGGADLVATAGTYDITLTVNFSGGAVTGGTVTMK